MTSLELGVERKYGWRVVMCRLMRHPDGIKGDVGDEPLTVDKGPLHLVGENHHEATIATVVGEGAISALSVLGVDHAHNQIANPN